MGERGQRVVIKDSIVSRHYSQWGGQTCMSGLSDGERGLRADLATCKEFDWVIPEFAEGGYLVDFDTRHMLLYSWDQPELDRILPRIRAAWPGWSIEIVPDGVPDFIRHVETRKLVVPEWEYRFILIDSSGNSELLETPRLEESSSMQRIRDRYWERVWYFSSEGRYDLRCLSPIPKASLPIRLWWNITGAQARVNFALDGPKPYSLDAIRSLILEGLPEGNGKLRRHLNSGLVRNLLAHASDFNSMLLAIGCINGEHLLGGEGKFRTYFESVRKRQ